MLSLANLALALSTVLATVLAFPNITAVPISGGCVNFPGYDPSTRLSAGFVLTTNSCENPTIEGYGSDNHVVYQHGYTGIHVGKIAIVANNHLAKTVLRCNSAIGPGSLEALTPISVSEYAYNMVNMSYYPTHMELGWGSRPSTYPVEIYSHFDESGKQIEGVFLGSGTSTTWGIKWYPADFRNLYRRPYWGLRLLVEDSNFPATDWHLYPGEYRTFLKVKG